MRYKPEHKTETHRKIVEAASREFRTHGYNGVAIPKLMGVLDLTHGGFYAHFADKEQLVAEASAAAMEESLNTILAALNMGGIPALLDLYLSEDHRDNPAVGCPLPTLSAEIARHSLAPRQAFTEKLAAVFDEVSAFMPGQTESQKQAQVWALFSSLAGAVSLARAVSDPQMSRDILQATRENLASQFTA